jgi:autotransporter-associated beta strand protein
VDFVPIHYYWCFNPADPNGAANQMYNFLKATYDQVKRPLWITEWNNGANWTGCGDPTFAQQQAAIAAMIQMLDDTPFVERYALYNWVEDVRRLKWDDGSLTAAGVTYRDKQSPIGYVQALSDNGTRNFGQYPFEGDALDQSGYGNNGVIAGSAAFTNGVRGRALVFDGANTRVTLPPNIARNNAFTFAAWVRWHGGASWQRLFDFGNSTTHYLFLTPSSSSGTLRFGLRNGGSTEQVDAPALPVNQWRHVAVTLSGGIARIYTNGVLAAQATGLTISPATFSPRVNFLGKSQWPSDPHFNGLMDEVLITDYALTATQVAALLTNTPPVFTTNVYLFPPGTNGFAYSGSLAGLATDADPGDTLSFSKPTGPAWLNVAADGTLSGTPTSGSGGTNWFTVRVVDAAGENGYAVLGIPVVVTSANGTWIADGSGNWGESNRWSGGVIASGPGQFANFSTINITGHRTVTVDTPRFIGTLRFSDTAATFFNWTLTNANDATLTLDTGSATSPAIAVTNTATLALPLEGTNGFTKSGPGTLILAGNNGLSGTVNIDTGSTSANDGTTRLVGPGALGNANLIQIRNNNSGTSTLELDGSSGSILVDADLSVTCRNSGVVTIRNLAGTNVLNGNLWLNVGGNSHTVEAAANSLLVFTGTNQYVGSLTGTRTNYFIGAGHILHVGPILNSTNGAPISLAKSGAGTLRLEAENTYGNGTTFSGGTLIVNGSLPAGPFAISAGTTLGGRGVLHAAVSLPAGAMLAPGDLGIGTLTASQNVTLLAGSVTRLELNPAATTNRHDQLRVLGHLTRGGTLTVTNLGGALWAGDAFRLFHATTSSGTFAATNLPPLPPGLAWRFDAPSGWLMVTEADAPAGPPAPPTAFQTAPEPGAIQLAWVQSASADVTSNRIYRSTSGAGGPFTLLAEIPSAFAYTDAGVVSGTTYHYYVTAIGPGGESAPSARAAAALVEFGPYTADAHTLLLFHFDEPAGAVAATNAGTLSASPGDRRAFAVNQASATATPPTVNTILGAPALPGFGLSAALGVNGHLIGWDANNSGAYQGDTGSVSADAVPLSTFNIGSNGPTPWTLEALIFPTNASPAQPRNAEILCTDSSATSRGFQFRLTTAGQLELHFISGASGGPAQQLVPLPTTGPHAYAASNWFHVAASYDGENVSLYWTKAEPGLTAANRLLTYPLDLGAAVGAISGPFVIGGENRAANTETFTGRIDEVRVSAVARGAREFFWTAPPAAPHPPYDLDAVGSPGQVLVTWSVVNEATAYAVKRALTNTTAFTLLTNVTSPTFVDTDVLPGGTYTYQVTAWNTAGESLPSLPATATVPVPVSPQIDGVTLTGGAFVLTGTGGWPNGNFHLLSATNLTLPLAAWEVLATNLYFAPDGSFAVTNPVTPNEAQRYYLLSVPVP